MHVLFITPYIPNSLRTRPYHLLKALACCHQLTLLAPVFNRQEQADAARLAAEIPGLSVETVQCSKKAAIAHSLKALSKGLPMQARFCYSPALLLRLEELAREKKFDVAHVEHFRAAYTGERLAAIGLPAVWDSVDCISLLVQRTLRHGPLKNRAISVLELNPSRRYERKLVVSAFFKQICATSAEDAAALEELGGVSNGTIRVIHNGVALDHFTPPTEPSAREDATVIFSGKLSYHANAAAARYLVEKVWGTVRREIPHARLQLAGSNPSNDLLRLSGKAGIEVTGFVPDIAPLLRRATLAVAPMLYSVGIQNKVLEAMACATPIIATHDVTRAIQVRDGIEIELVEQGNPAELARRIVELLRDKRRATEMGHRGREYVACHYNWAQAARAIEEMWQLAVRHAAVIPVS